MYAPTISYFLCISITRIVALDLDLLVPTSEIDLAKQTTTTRIYLDFKIFTLTTEETQLIFDMFKTIHDFITSSGGSEPGEVPEILNNVLKDLTNLKRLIREINAITKQVLGQEDIKHFSNPCTFIRQLLSQSIFNDLIESLQLIKNKFPPSFSFTDQDKLNPESEKFQLLANSLLAIKGSVHEFLALFDKQYSAISVFQNFDIPTETTLSLNLNKCVRTYGKETFHIEKVQYYNKGVFVTIKMTQNHDFETFRVLKPIPIAGIILDLNHLYSPASDNSTFYHQTCSEFYEIKNCQLSIVQTPCIDAIKQRHISNILLTCPILQSTQIIPFLTLNGIFIPPQAKLTLLYPDTHSPVSNHSLSFDTIHSPFLLKSEFTTQVDFNKTTYFFGPTANDNEIILSYFTSEDFQTVYYFLYPLLNPSYQIYLSLAGVLSISLSLIVGLSIKLLNSRKPKKHKNTKYVASIHRSKANSFKKVKK